MKIAFDAKRIFHNPTGLGNYARNLFHGLYHLFSDEEYILMTPDSESALFDPSTYPYTQVISPKSRPKTWRNRGMVKDLNDLDVDVYHGLSNELPLGLHKLDIASIVTIHDIIWSIYPKTYKSVDRKIFKRKTLQAIKQADKIIAVSQSTKSDIIEYFDVDPDHIEVIYPAVHPMYYDGQAPNTEILERLNLTEPYYLFVGNIEPRKNISLIIEALANIPSEERFKLVVVGQGKKHKEVLINQALTLGVHYDIMWLENVTDSDLKALYSFAAMFIYPSIYEGFGMPIAEALFSKVPVITSSTSALPEASGVSSVHIDPEDSQSLTAAMLQVQNDKNLSAEMTELGYDYAKSRFTTDVVSRHMMRLYRSLA